MPTLRELGVRPAVADLPGPVRCLPRLRKFWLGAHRVPVPPSDAE